MQTTGRIGELILITGENLYGVSGIFFNGVSGQFTETINSNYGELRAVVPDNASWGFVTIYNILGYSGQSTEKFVPEPLIKDFSPRSGIPGDKIIISGAAFSGVTGISFNNLTGLFTVLNNTGISATVPTGNTYGVIKAFGQSGLSFSTTEYFTPIALITGLSTYSGSVGQTVSILGTNFITDILFEQETNNYLVSFGGITGLATRTNNTLLQATIPAEAVSGILNIHQTPSIIYPSDFSFKVLNPAPTITSLSPNSGIILSQTIIRGQNLFDITDVRFSGHGFDISAFDSNAIVGALGDAIFVNVPYLNGGDYDIIVKSLMGNVTGSGYFTVLEAPEISGFSPSVTTTGVSILVSGRNIYPFSTFYLNDFNDLPVSVESGSSANNLARISFDHRILEENTILINNTVGTNQFTGYYLYLVGKPQISGFTPLTGRWGDSIIVSGTGFAYADSVSFYSGNALFTKLGATGLSFKIPTGSFNSVIQIYSTGGMGESLDLVDVYPDPVEISGFNPLSVSMAGEVLISGNYLNTTTGVSFSGSNNLEITGSFRYLGTTGLMVTIPSPAISGKISIYNKFARTQSSQGLNIYQPPVLSSFNLSGAYLETINFTGQYLTSSDIYFKSVSSGFIKGIETVILSDSSGRTKVPREILRDFLYSSGHEYFVTNSGIETFTPVPTLTGFNPTTKENDNIIILTGINAFECSTLGIAIRSGTSVYNFIDNPIDLFVNNTGATTGGFTIVSGKIGTDYIGTGFPAIISKYNDSVFSGGYIHNSGYSSNLLTINIGAPVISGFSTYSGGWPGYVYITGHNLKTSYVLEYFDVNSFAVSDLPTDIITINNDLLYCAIPSGDLYGNKSDENSSGNFFLANSNSVVQSFEYFTYNDIPVFSGVSPQRLFTGRYFVVTGANLKHINRLEIINATNEITSVFQGVYPDGFGGYVVSGYIPGDIRLSDQDYFIAGYNNASGSVISGVTMQILNIRDVEAQDSLSSQILLFSPNRGTL